MKVLKTLSLFTLVLVGMSTQAQRFEGSIGFTKNIGPRNR